MPAQSFSLGYAVSVGAGADLPVTVGDATGIAHLLNDPARCAYPRDQVRLLTEGDARRQEVLDALDWLAQSATPEDTAVVYFSGHGMLTPQGHYLLPNSYDLQSVDQTCISDQVLTEKLRAVQAQKLLVLLDCCHAGGIGEAKAPGDKSPLPPTAVETLSQGE